MFGKFGQNEQVMNIQNQSAYPYIEFLAKKWEPKYEYSQLGEENRFHDHYKGKYVFLQGTKTWLVNRNDIWKSEALLKIYLVIRSDTKIIYDEIAELRNVLKNINTSNKMDIKNDIKRKHKKQLDEWHRNINEKIVTATNWLRIRNNVLMDAIDSVKSYPGMSRGIETFEITNRGDLKIKPIEHGKVNPMAKFHAKKIY